MIGTIFGILLFLWIMLSINHSSGTSGKPTDQHIQDIASGKITFQEALDKIQGKTSSPALPSVPVITTPITSVCTEESVVPLNEIVYKNIAHNHPTPLNWFLCPHPDLPAPSHAEALIITELNKYKVKWYREVSFYGLQVNKKSHPRYDLWIPSKRLIIEYDGAAYHNDPHTKAMDKLKNKFCREQGIHLIRWNKSHYYHIPARVSSLMEQYNIPCK